MGNDSAKQGEDHYEISIRDHSDGYTRLSIGQSKFLITGEELKSLEDELTKETNGGNSSHVINHPESTNDIFAKDINTEFDEKVIFDGLKDIDGIGDVTAMRILEKLALRSHDGVKKEELREMDGVGNKTIDKAWVYLMGYQDGAAK